MASQTAIQLTAQGFWDKLAEFKEPRPSAGKHEVLIKVQSVALNFRDIAIKTGQYLFPVKEKVVPGSDAAGNIIETGEGVSGFKKGDKCNDFSLSSFPTTLDKRLAIAPILAGCPYARDLGLKADEKENPHAYSPRGPVPTKSSVASLSSATPSASADKKGLFLVNRIAPGTSKLYIANADARTSALCCLIHEHNGDGNSDIYRVRPDDSNFQPIVTSPAVEDSVVISSNEAYAAYVSTTNNYKANI